VKSFPWFLTQLLSLIFFCQKKCRGWVECDGPEYARTHMGFYYRESVVAITEGKLDFGTWEQIFYGEFDGRRKKRVLVKIIGE